MKIHQFFISALIALLSVSSSVVAFNVQQQSRPQSQAEVSRAQWLQTAGGVFAGMIMGTATPAWAAKDDPALKGTKKDPAFEACLSTCMYECTKPKGYEQKTRQECLPECKSKCAETKAQLMLGLPAQKE